MLNNHSNAFEHASCVLNAILQKLQKLSKPQFKFLSTLFPLWWSISGRYNFFQMSRYGNYHEQSYRLWFEKKMDFAQFNTALIQQRGSGKYIVAFDPSYISKSGKHTPGISIFWSGKDQCAKKGLEIGVLSVVDVVAGTAMSLEAKQTPSSAVLKAAKKTLVDHYAEYIISRASSIKQFSKYLVADGYFAKKDFIQVVMGKGGLHVITKLRDDANLRYLYNGPQKPGKGRKKIHDGKVELKKIDKRRITLVWQDDEYAYYTAIVHSITLKMKVRIIYIEDKKTKKYAVLASTDTALKAGDIVQYYRLRFQIEFLIRDAKQHTGLEDCQARSENKLYFHFNVALSSVSLAKAVFYLSVPKQKREAFSMRNVKLLYHNKLIADTIFSNLDIDLSCKKIKRLYNECLYIGTLAA